MITLTAAPNRFPSTKAKSNQSSETVVRFDLPDAPSASRTIVWEAAYSANGLRRVTLLSEAEASPRATVSLTAPAVEKKIKALKQHLLDRLKGGRGDLDWEDFDLDGTGEFHQKVWRAMRAIPFGETATYGDVARDAGSPLAFRACGQACGANRILIFIPCHRVVSSTGLGGFGYGLEWKKHFLAMESRDNK